MNKKYYKIIFPPSKVPDIEDIINTEDTVDELRFKRYSELKPLYELIYNCSEKYNLQLQYIIDFLLVNRSRRNIKKFGNCELKHTLKQIKKKSKILHFCLIKEFRYFTDYVLEKVQNNLDNGLPDRYKVNYFFESMVDCYRYLRSLSGVYEYKIFEVEFIETSSCDKFDNHYTSYFEPHSTAKDFYIQAFLYLLKIESSNPLWEVLFSGKYKITKQII